MTRDFVFLVGDDCILSLFLIRRHFGFVYRILVGSWIVRGSDPETVYRTRLVAQAWMFEGVPSWSIDQVFAYRGLEFIHVPPETSDLIALPAPRAR